LPGGRNAAGNGIGQSCRKSEGQNARVWTADCQDTDTATRTDLYVATLNLQSLTGEDKLEEMENELTRIKWDIIELEYLIIEVSQLHGKDKTTKAKVPYPLFLVSLR